MMDGQGLKRSLATQMLTKVGTHIQTQYTNKTVQTENMVDGEVVLKGWVL